MMKLGDEYLCSLKRLDVCWVVATQIFCIFTPNFAEDEHDEPILTIIFFQMGWFNHQLVMVLFPISMFNTNGSLVVWISGIPPKQKWLLECPSKISRPSLGEDSRTL